MEQVIYASRVADEVEMHDVTAILAVAKEKNSHFGITGMLIYDGHYFLQCIEGSRSALDHLLENIAKDSRHYEMKIIGRVSIATRDFEEWSMGYAHQSHIIKKALLEVCGMERFTPLECDYESALQLIRRIGSLALLSH